MFSYVRVQAPDNTSDPLFHLAIWCCAGFERLYQLFVYFSGELEMPSIPCWTVRGHKWELYMAKRHSPDAMASHCSNMKWCQLKSIKAMHGPLLHRTTESTFDAVSLVMVIAQTMQWGPKEYADWFWKHAIPEDVSEHSSLDFNFCSFKVYMWKTN